MQKAVDFYTKKLGLPLRMQSEGWSEVGGQENGVYIGLHMTEKVDAGESTDLSFRVENVEATRKQLEENGVEFYDKITQISPTSSFTSFTDPDGNKLSIYQST